MDEKLKYKQIIFELDETTAIKFKSCFTKHGDRTLFLKKVVEDKIKQNESSTINQDI